jgi:hypothetical protein
LFLFLFLFLCIPNWSTPFTYSYFSPNHAPLVVVATLGTFFFFVDDLPFSEPEPERLAACSVILRSSRV